MRHARGTRRKQHAHKKRRTRSTRRTRGGDMPTVTSHLRKILSQPRNIDTVACTPLKDKPYLLPLREAIGRLKASNNNASPAIAKEIMTLLDSIPEKDRPNLRECGKTLTNAPVDELRRYITELRELVSASSLPVQPAVQQNFSNPMYAWPTNIRKQVSTPTISENAPHQPLESNTKMATPAARLNGDVARARALTKPFNWLSPVSQTTRGAPPQTAPVSNVIQKALSTQDEQQASIAAKLKSGMNIHAAMQQKELEEKKRQEEEKKKKEEEAWRRIYNNQKKVPNYTSLTKNQRNILNQLRRNGKPAPVVPPAPVPRRGPPPLPPRTSTVEQYTDANKAAALILAANEQSTGNNMPQMQPKLGLLEAYILEKMFTLPKNGEQIDVIKKLNEYNTQINEDIVGRTTKLTQDEKSVNKNSKIMYMTTEKNCIALIIKLLNDLKSFLYYPAYRNDTPTFIKFVRNIHALVQKMFSPNTVNTLNKIKKETSSSLYNSIDKRQAFMKLYSFEISNLIGELKDDIARRGLKFVSTAPEISMNEINKIKFNKNGSIIINSTQ